MLRAKATHRSDNVLSRLGGNDVLDGGDGNDTLIGGLGRDVPTGGGRTSCFRGSSEEQFRR
jgi:Ca2+-binding RTX toxin-like protein